MYYEDWYDNEDWYDDDDFTCNCNRCGRPTSEYNITNGYCSDCYDRMF